MNSIVFFIGNFIVFSLIHLVHFSPSDKKGYTQRSKTHIYIFLENMLIKRLYKRIVTVNTKPLFGSWPNLPRFCLATRKNYSSPEMSKNINRVFAKKVTQVHPIVQTISSAGPVESTRNLTWRCLANLVM